MSSVSVRILTAVVPLVFLLACFALNELLVSCRVKRHLRKIRTGAVQKTR